MRSERGFTLLEVLIAFAIAALALALLFRAASGGLLSVETSGRYEEAVARARSHMAALGQEAALVAGNSEGDDGGGYRWHLAVTPVATGRSQAPGPGAAPPFMLYAVVVSISWHDVGKDREFVLRSERMGQANAQ
ncbi:MAG TPA: prepilin-type N-terminal cleavage/methylation domain-containing protein [Aliidongia sp.]|nr:prepilin-type N-terminal cleavage/methylation domain-containing protein [Aliidongia sp.]